MKRSNSTNIQFVQRIPADVKLSASGMTLRIPLAGSFVEKTISPSAVDIRLSLRTSDPSEAKVRQAAVAAHLETVRQRLRSGPIRLLHSQIVALSADKYRAFIRAFENEPGPSERWTAFTKAIHKARKPRIEPAVGEIDTARAEAMEKRFGQSADEILSEKGLIIDAESRTLLLEAIATAELDAAETLLKRSQLDYSPDPKAGRFPEWTPPPAANTASSKAKAAKETPEPSLTPQKLFDLWSDKHQDQLAPATVRRYRASWQSLISFFNKRDVTALTGDDIYAWAEHRRDAEGASPGSINKNDLVAASSVFKWGMDRDSGRLLSSNPVTGVRLIEPRKVQQRERTFREDEVKMLLGLASSVKTDLKNPTLSHAQRWCQWLAAYSGARIAETTGLTGADITVEEGVHVMHFRKTKTGIPRTIPLHAHLIEQGFLEFVRSSAGAAVL